MPFSSRSLDFLFENKLHDSKQWYQEHKDIYIECVVKPFTEIIEKLAPVMERIDSSMICSPQRISRIYRDTRFSKDKSLFRDNIWLTVSRPKPERFHDLPCFYVDISGDGVSYGCGYYSASKEVMDELRQMILSNDKMFTKAKKSFENQSIFTLDGDAYKRNHFPEQPPELCRWLNLRNIYAHSFTNDFDLIFSDRLADKIAEELPLLEDFYKLLITAEAG
ncbi:MAG: DUF2461 domain-containing protein [Huintestinicola sp.]